MTGRRPTILVGSLAVALLVAALAAIDGRAAPAVADAQPSRQAALVTPTATATATPTPTATPAIPIANATPVACGQSVSGDTSGATNHVSVYGCAPWLPLTGPERVYSLHIGPGVQVDALLSGLHSDLDLLLLSDASPLACIAHGDNAISASGLASGVYYLVVDGFDDAAGPFRLDVWCPLAVTPTVTPTATPTATPPPRLLKHYLPLLLHSAEARR
jgi:hypothetical protein